MSCSGLADARLRLWADPPRQGLHPRNLRHFACNGAPPHAVCPAMIDTLTIFFSTFMCLLVVFRAIKLDAEIPWFGKPHIRLGQPGLGQPTPKDAPDAP